MLDYTHLQALLAVEREGSFEKAGEVLGMSSIGVASRVKKLEARMGVQLLTRKPTKSTDAGQALCRYTSEIVTLEDELIEEQRDTGLQSGHQTKHLKIAITDDSLTCWFGKALGAKRPGEDHPLLLDVTMYDLDHTIDLMRNGVVIAALTSSKQPVYGFKSYRLGERRYRAVASPDFIARYFTEGVSPETISSAPSLRHSAEDSFCLQWLDQQFGTNPKLLSSQLPKLHLMIDMCVSGSGWTLLPEPKITDHLKAGRLVELIPDTPLTKTIYWHIAHTMDEPFTHLTKIVRDGFPLSSNR